MQVRSHRDDCFPHALPGIRRVGLTSERDGNTSEQPSERRLSAESSARLSERGEGGMLTQELCILTSPAIVIQRPSGA